MLLLLSLLSFLGVVLIVVTVHEWGHYLAARAFGVRVLRFSVGFGKPLWLRRDEYGTEWVVAPIPLGGYVRMLDRRTAREEKLPDAETMEAKSCWRRIVIYAAGPAANIVLAFLIYILLLAGGESGLPPVVGEVKSGGIAANAGLHPGARITAVNGEETPLWRRVELALADAVIAGEDIVIDGEGGDVYHIAAGRPGADDLIAGIGEAFGVFPPDDYITPKARIVAPDGPAAAAGVLVGDDIVMIDGAVVDRWRDVLFAIRANPGGTVDIVLWREAAALTVTATLAEAAAAGGRRRIGYLGVAPEVDRAQLNALLVTVRYSPPALLAAAAARAGRDVARMLGFLRLLLTGGASADNLSGPIGIAEQSGQAAAVGIGVWLGFVAFISVSLAVVNLLPLPVLDGGQILLNVIQLLRRRDMPDAFLRLWEGAGVAVILALMMWVIFNDVINLI